MGGVADTTSTVGWDIRSYRDWSRNLVTKLINLDDQ
jgi:hypothetical protein